MFATMVIVLPSHFAGGELVVKHGKTDIKTFEQAAQSSFGTQYAAFYADTKHELKVVTSGHRLCLVYNFVKTGYGTRPTARAKEKIARRLKAAARQWADEYDDKKIVLMTKHKYTPAGIKNGSTSAKYKGSDAAVVELLELAGAELDYDYGTLSFTETGTGEGGGDGWGYSYRNRYDDEDEGSYTWGETLDSDLSLSLATWGDVHLNYDEKEPLEEHFCDSDPIDTTYEPTGNEGVNASRQYEDTGALVIWPRSQRWKIATNNDTARMIRYLEKACQEGTPDSESKEDCKEKAEIIMQRVRGNASQAATLMKCIVKIGDADLGKKLLTSCLEEKQTSDELIGQMQSIIDTFGSDAITPILVSSISSRFVDDPTAIANFLIKCRTNLCRVASNSQLIERLTGAFVDAMFPQEKENWCVPKKALDSFPLDGILSLFVRGKCLGTLTSFVYDKFKNPEALAKRVLRGYTWISCQKIQEQSQYSWQLRAKEPKGPTLLLNAALSIGTICDAFGWADYEDVLVEAVEKLCLHGSSDTAAALVNKLAAPPLENASDRFRVCARMASVVCEKILARSKSTAISQHAGTYKKLGTIIGNLCPSMAPIFVESAKALSIDGLYEVVSDKALRSSSSSTMKSALGLLTLHCAQILKSRVSTKLSSVATWTIPHANLARNSTYSSFLRCPCKQVYDWAVRKTDHKGFMADLAPLIHLGEIKAESYQPRGRGNWHFKITKLKSSNVPVSRLATMSCSCSEGSHSRYSYSSYQRQAANCRLKTHKVTLSKYAEDQKKFLVVKSLLNLEQRSELERGNGLDSHKRTASTVTGPTRTSVAASMPATATPATVSRMVETQPPRQQEQPQRPAKKPKQASTSSEVIDLT